MASKSVEFGKTISYAPNKVGFESPFFVSVFTSWSEEGMKPEFRHYSLERDFKGDIIRFGRAEDNDIVLSSPLISAHHGHFEIIPASTDAEGAKPTVKVVDDGSTNKIYINGKAASKAVLCDNDIIRIDNIDRPLSTGVLMFMSASPAVNYKLRKLREKRLVIGRSRKANLRLPHLTVSRKHIALDRMPDGSYRISNLSQTNPVILNNELLLFPRPLKNRDVILLSAYELVYLEGVGLVYKEDPKNLSEKVQNDIKTTIRRAKDEEEKRRAERYNRISIAGSIAEAITNIAGLLRIGM